MPHPECFMWRLPPTEGFLQMKRTALPLLFASVLASVLAFAQVQGNGALTGAWQVHTSVSGNESDAVCTFAQKDNNLTGTCATDQGASKLIGKVDGTKVSWSYDSEYNGSPLTVTYSGTLASGKITGDVDVEPFAVDGDFTATQSK